MFLSSKLYMRTNTEITDINISLIVHQNISCFDIPMNLSLRMEVRKTFQRLFEDSCHNTLVFNTLFELFFKEAIY